MSCGTMICRHSGKSNSCNLARDGIYCCLLFNWALFCVIAWKPDLILATDRRDPHVSHWMKNSLVSFWRMVSGDRHVWHVTYSSVRQIENSALDSWYKIKPLNLANLDATPKQVSEVSIPAKWPIRLELITVSTALSDQEYFYSHLDGMLVHPKATPSIKFAGAHLYTWVKRGIERVSVLSKVTTQCL